jgi:hypothetical protein
MIRPFAALCASILLLHAADNPGARWWKGNLHTHSLWSDGDDFPEMITGWYKTNGYHFLAISDHNVLNEGERWSFIGTNRLQQSTFDKYVRRFGTNWVQTRNHQGRSQVRLKPLSEYAPLFEEAGKFLLIPSEEITDKFKTLPVHLNASNIRDFIKPQGGNSVREVMQNNVDAVLEQGRATGQRMLPHLNHPNFEWGVTAEDLAAVRGERFFEVYNGHPHVHNEGDELHASADRMWDIALVLRLTSPQPEALYGVAVDDSHNYHKHGIGQSNSGRGWIMVRSHFLTPESIIHALEKGDFYATSGILLKSLRAAPNHLEFEIQTKSGVQYRTEFIGTRRGFDPASHPVKDKDGNELPVTRRYSPQVGEILAVVEGKRAAYRAEGNELYVRARIISSKPKQNPSATGEMEMAWTQPIFPGASPAP